MLEPRDRGTLLQHTVEACPRGLFGRAAAAVEIGQRARRGLDRVYKRIDSYLSQRRRERPHGPNSVRNSARNGDPFEPPPKLDSLQQARIERVHDRLCELGISPEVAGQLAEHLRTGPPQEVGRIRPRVLARNFAADEREVLRACLHAAKEGALSLCWDVICPHCQVPSSVEDSLQVLRERGYCEACDVDFELDFRSSVELIFRAHPSVRESEQGTYCIGGPAHTPHVLAQLRLSPGERFVLDTKLDDGSYRIAGRGLPVTWGFRVENRAPLRGWELSLRNGLPPTVPRALASGNQRVALTNDLEREVLVRLERGSGREDALTAAEAACSPAFRELFPTEVLSSGQLIGVSAISLVLIELCEPWNRGDSETQVFGRLSELCRTAEPCIHAEGGAVVKLHGNGLMASFPDPVAATRAGLRLSQLPEARQARVAAHAGAAMATTINARLDYFGRVVHEASALLARAAAGQMVVSEALYADPGVWALLGSSGQIVQVVGVDHLFAQVLQPAGV